MGRFAYTHGAAAPEPGRDHDTLDRPERAGFRDGPRAAAMPAATPEPPMATLLEPSTPPMALPSRERPRAGGKFLFAGGEKLYLRGVTYGTFRPNADGDEFPEPAVVERDFQLMAAHGINAVRTYTAPPRWLLDRAWGHGLRIMVGLAAE